MTQPLLQRLNLDFPILQAPMGGGVSTPELAAAVSSAGALGSLGMRAPASFRRAVLRARELAPGKSLALGLLLPFTQRVHVDAVLASNPEAVVLMAGFAPEIVQRLRAAGIFVVHQIGSRADAERALRDGADGLIAQGVEAGGHVLGQQRAHALLAEVLPLAGDKPVLLAGGIATADDVRAALARGAAGVVAGTRYLLTREAGAHPAYQRRVLGAQRTLLTTLFGVGWNLKHRVVPNAATDRYCDESGRVPAWVTLVQRAAEPLVQRVGMLRDAAGHATRTFNFVPLFLPNTLQPTQAESGVEYTALYAGETAARIHSIESAFDVTRELARGAQPA